MSKHLKEYLNRLRKCGLHSISCLSPSQRTVILDATYASPDFTFFYKHPDHCVFEIDFHYNTIFLRAHPIGPDFQRHVSEVLGHLAGRFKRVSGIILDDTSQYPIAPSSPLLNTHSHPQKTHTYIYTHKRNNHNIKYHLTLCNSRVTFPSEVNSDFRPITQRIRFTSTATYITFDPPLLIPAHRDEHIAIFTPHPSIKLNSAPRWNKLRKVSRGTEYKLFTFEGSFSLRHYMVIPTTPPDPDHAYADELCAFHKYATSLRNHANHSATIIQRAFRRAISDPHYVMCRRRLLSEFESLQVPLTQ